MDGLTRALVEGAAAVFKPRGPVLEIGSRQVQEGLAIADLRPIFTGLEYVGCDMEAGAGVDRIERLEALSFPDGWAGTVLCLNVLEHAWDFRAGLAEILRVTAQDGMAMILVPFNLHIHAFSYDYWRFTPEAIVQLMGPFESVLYGWQGHPKAPRLVFALGFRRRRSDLPALAEAWRRQTLACWTEHPSAWKRFGAGLGGAIFGKRYFRVIRHWWDLAIQVRDGPKAR